MKTTRPMIPVLVAAAVLAASVGLAACADDSTSVGDSTHATLASDETDHDEIDAAADEPIATTPIAAGSAIDDGDDVGDEPVAVDPVATTDRLTADDVGGLTFMREEEQLAHDVYAVLDAQWDLQIFGNIAEREVQHVDSVVGLLDQFGLSDPAAGNEPGSFTNPQLQELYDQLVVEGSVSLVAALEVGAYIEELDIVDLRARAAATDVADIVALYAQLERGSRNHLRAFSSQLEARNVTYEPTQLDRVAYDEIVSSPRERGRNRSRLAMRYGSLRIATDSRSPLSSTG